MHIAIMCIRAGTNNNILSRIIQYYAYIIIILLYSSSMHTRVLYIYKYIYIMHNILLASILIIIVPIVYDGYYLV